MANHVDVAAARREVWKITIYLTILTLVELALGFIMFKMDWAEGSFIKLFTKIVIIFLMTWKAFYIISYFMHLKFEAISLIKMIGIPCILFVWFILAFLWDGGSFKMMRERYDPYHVDHFSQPMQQVPAHEKVVPAEPKDTTPPVDQKLPGEDTQH